MGDKDKKRKRAEESGSRPSKKAAVLQQQQQPQPQQQDTKIKIASVKEAGSCPPILATAPGLDIKSSTKFQAYSKAASAPANAKRSKKNANPPPQPDIMLHSSSHPRVDYMAKEEGPGGRESHLKHYIAVFDPQTSQLSVVEAKKMTVRGTVRAQKPPEEDVEARKKSMFEQRTNLGTAFGTKKAKKALESITENAIAPEKTITDLKQLNSSSQAVMDTIKQNTAGLMTREEMVAATDAAKPVPPCNLEADEIQDVYKPEVMIGQEVLAAIPIKDWEELIKKDESTSHTSRFVAARLKTIGDGPGAKTRLRTLRYLDFLIKFVKLARPGKERGVKRVPPKDKLQSALQPAPLPVVESIRRKFSNNGEMRKFHVDLVNTYCCALAAIVANYEFDTYSVASDLGLEEKEFAQYFKEIGGRVKSLSRKGTGTQGQMAVLSLPLEFPKTRFIRPKGR